MAAIITDQIRLLNASNFVAGVTSTTNAYYSFIGLPNPTDVDSDWNNDPPAPKDPQAAIQSDTLRPNQAKFHSLRFP